MEYLYKLMNRSHDRDKSVSPTNGTGMSLPNSAIKNNNVQDDECLSKSVSFGFF